MREVKKDCLSCANSFSEALNDPNKSDVLHCMEQGGKVVKEDDCCEKYN